jgi:hypothetical protein
MNTTANTFIPNDTSAERPVACLIIANDKKPKMIPSAIEYVSGIMIAVIAAGT